MVCFVTPDQVFQVAVADVGVAVGYCDVGVAECFLYEF